MKKIVYNMVFTTIIGLTILMCSCGSSKSSLKTKMESEYSTAAKRREESKTNEVSKTKEAEDTTEVTEAETVEYDTSTAKPDGSNPVKSKTTVKTTKVNGKVKEETKEIVNNTISTEDKSESGKEKADIAQKEEEKETSIVKHIGVILWAVFGVSLLVFLWKTGILSRIIK